MLICTIVQILILYFLSSIQKSRFVFLYVNGTMTNVAQDSKECRGKSSIAAHFLVILFGVSTWIGINGIFIQTPVLINTSPEAWRLPAYLVLVIQSANLGPLVYAVLQYFHYKINEPWWILCLLVSGTTAMGLLTYFHSETVVIAGDEYSLILFILTFFNALVGCFSSVLFMPYLRNFSEQFLISYFIGEGLSGVLPSVIALIQGIGDTSECEISKNVTSDSPDLTFSSSDYFLFIFIILFLSLTAFASLEYFSFVKKIKRESDLHADDVVKVGDDGLTKQTRNYLFTLLAVCCFLSNGFFPSIQSYSCLPYGNMAYKLSITFAQFANPTACLFAYWLKVTNVTIINYLSGICLIIGSYVTYLAVMSPSPPLQASEFGIYLVIISWTVLVGFISYLKLIIVSMFRSEKFENVLFNAGVIMQIGSATGAIFSFITINFTNYFEMRNNCVSNG
ncbi:solute carrier family 52, riboflavin transporter, member 3-A-like [Ceratina calcarata]|uniref:Riboflavin transporter n=1 Tax=Ceratina calcarata TaxID=156304 RepID=A0AAJ7ITQ3_9HYME|nr:solute carrier family 52, riboflavin transporter, member 3-A-like [Ceratina calcarata]